MKKLVLLTFLCTTFSNVHAQTGFEKHPMGESHRISSNSDRFIPFDVDGDKDLDIYFNGIRNYQEDIRCGSGFLEKNDSFKGYAKAKCVGIEEENGSSNLHAEDVDGDGDMDLLDTRSYSPGAIVGSELRWYANLDGKGTFSSKKIISFKERVRVNSIKTADLDNDGDMDVIASGKDIIWYENVDNFETVQEGTIISGNYLDYFGTHFENMIIEDVDGDNDLDIIASSSADYSAIVLFRNIDGKGSYAEREIIYQPEEEEHEAYLYHFVLNDADLDGDRDIIFLNRAENNIYWFENVGGSGNFAPEIGMDIDAEGIHRIYSADMDGDGHEDLISTAWDFIRWYEKLDGTEKFGIPQTIAEDYKPNYYFDWDGNIAIADLNSDGRNDIFYTTHYDYDTDSNAGWLENKGSVENKISGHIQTNFDGNGCSTGDFYVPNLMLASVNNGSTTRIGSNEDGFYEFFTYTGEFSVSVSSVLPDYYEVSPDSQTVNFTGIGNKETLDFCLSANRTVNDLNVTLTPTTENRPGFEASYELNFTNMGTTQLTGSILLEFDGRLEFLSSSESLDSRTQESLSIPFENLKGLETRSIFLKFKTPVSVDLGEILNFTTQIFPVVDDYTMDDNVHELEQLVIGSYDPNDIKVLEGNSILEDEIDKYLNYVVRFQNTGTASAINVRIEHEFDENLDWETFVPVTSSHSNTTAVNNGNEVEFLFEDINLPDSTANEPASHGYIAFKVKPKKEVLIGDTIKAKADIYFDFNEPITTNTATTEIEGLPSPIEVDMEETHLTCEDPNGAILIDASGGIPPYFYYLRDSNQKSIAASSDNSFSFLASGDYHVWVVDSSGGRFISEVVSIDEPETISTDIEIIKNTCKGLKNGIIEVNATGQYPPFEYGLSPYALSLENTFTDLDTRNYTLYIRDANGCVSKKHVSVGNQNDPDLDNDGNLDPCDDDMDGDGILNENDNCPKTANPNQEDSNNNGIGDACEEVSTLKVTTTILSEIQCNEEHAAIKSEATGGTAPYAYELLTEESTVVERSSDGVFNNVRSGSYYVKVIDANADERTGDLFFIEGPDKVLVQAEAKGETCNLGDGTITVNASGGSGNYLYKLNNGAFVDSNSFTELVAGEYVVTVQDGNNCTEEIKLTVYPDHDCSDFTLPMDNFTIQTTSETCSNRNNGKIEVIVKESHGYEAFLSGDGSHSTKTFTDAVAFTDLQAGKFDLCFTVTGEPGYSKCFSINITEPEVLKVHSEVDTTGKLITLKMKGGKSYNINVNGKLYHTSDNEITLPLSGSKNTISVNTDYQCQGLHQETVLLAPGVLVFPNPIKEGDLTLVVGDMTSVPVSLILATSNGTVLFQKNQKPVNGSLKINLDSLSSGTYLLQIKTENKIYTHKIIKK